MQRFLCRYLFIFAALLMHKVLARRLWDSPEYFAQTMELIDLLFDQPKAFQWKCRMINLMNSYPEYCHE